MAAKRTQTKIKGVGGMFTAGHNKEWREGLDHQAKLQYPDGCYIGLQPNEDEINAHWNFWMAQMSKEQMEVVDSMRTIQIVKQYQEKLKECNPEQAVERAIKFWAYYWPHAYEDFMAYIENWRSRCRQNGMDETKSVMWVGSIPTMVDHFVRMYDPNMCKTLPGQKVSQLHVLFFKLFPKARIANA